MIIHILDKVKRQISKIKNKDWLLYRKLEKQLAMLIVNPDHPSLRKINYQDLWKIPGVYRSI